MSARFREYVTEQAFSLTLKKTHIHALQIVATGDGTRAHAMGIWVPSVNGLIRRGLVTHHLDKCVGIPAENWSEIYTLTRAGELAIEMLKEAGMIAIADNDQAAA